MVSDSTRLNIERARAALARARIESPSDAVRSPRPVDLSRMDELGERRERLEARATEFRKATRARLGLGESRLAGPSVTETLGSAVMTGALCDADVCAPRPPHVPAAKLNPAPPAPRANGQPSLQANRAPAKKRKKFLGIF